MKLYIKQKVFSIGERFYVRNEDGADVFYVEGSFLRIPKEFRIYDMSGNLLATIEKQMFRLLSRYDIQTEHEFVTLKRHFTFLFNRFSLEGLDWELEGNFTSHEYQLIKGERPIMSLTKHWFTWGDSYELNIEHPEDALLCLCIVIAVDAAVANDGNNAQAA